MEESLRNFLYNLGITDITLGSTFDELDDDDLAEFGHFLKSNYEFEGQSLREMCLLDVLEILDKQTVMKVSRKPKETVVDLPQSPKNVNLKSDSCIFCRIIAGKSSCYKIYESEHWFCFLDISPLAFGHILISPKCHVEKMTDVPEEYLNSFGSVVQRMCRLVEAENFNILSNNGEMAFQSVFHLHYHVIPKFSGREGLQLGKWQPSRSVDLASVQAKLLEKL